MRGGGAYGEAENVSLCAVPHRDRFDHAVHSAKGLLSFKKLVDRPAGTRAVN